MTNQTSSSYLRQAGISYGVAGLFLLPVGLPYWLGSRTLDQDPLLKAHHLFSIVNQVNDFKETIIQLWGMVLGTLALVMAHYSLWRVGQPTGWAKRYLLLLPLLGSICHLLCFISCFRYPLLPLARCLRAWAWLLLAWSVSGPDYGLIGNASRSSM